MKTEAIVWRGEWSVGLEPDATTLYDLSPFKNHATAKGSGEPNAIQLESGLWVWDFDSDDYYEIPHAQELDFDDDFFVYFWMSSDVAMNSDMASNPTIFRKVDAFQLIYYKQSSCWIFYPDYVGNKYGIVSDTKEAGEWFFIGIRWDNSVPGGYLSLNGRETAIEMHGPGPLAQSTENIRFGVQNWDGKMTPPVFGRGYSSTGHLKDVFESQKHWLGKHQ